MDIMVNLELSKFETMLEESKPILFFKEIGKQFSKCENIYIFERGSGNKVIGKCQLGNIHPIETSKIGTYGMLPFYVQHILKDDKLFKQVKKVYEMELENFDKSIKLEYLYHLEGLKKLQENENFSFFSLSSNEMRNYLEKKEMSRKLVKNCDNWLKRIGYYDNYEETFYQYFIECENLEKVNLLLTDFSNNIPKGWCYCERL